MLNRKTFARTSAAATLVVMAQFGAACGTEVTVWGEGTGGSGSGSTGSLSNGSSTSSTASGGGSDLAACSGAGQCTLVANSCCGVCGQPALSDLTAIHQNQLDAYRDAVCGEEPPPCPACATEPNPNLFAYCDLPTDGNGSCVAADVRQHELSTCQQDSDCRLRLGVECCEPCFDAESELIAIRIGSGVALGGLVCGPEINGCDECAPNYPDDAVAVCESGNCAVAFEKAPPPGG